MVLNLNILLCGNDKGLIQLQVQGKTLENQQGIYIITKFNVEIEDSYHL